MEVGEPGKGCDIQVFSVGPWAQPEAQICMTRGTYCIVHYRLEKKTFYCESISSNSQYIIWNSVDDSENHDLIGNCWVWGHSGRIEVEINLEIRWLGYKSMLMFRHVSTERWYHNDAAYFLLCKTAVGDPDHDESLSPSLGSEVWKVREAQFYPGQAFSSFDMTLKYCTMCLKRSMFGFLMAGLGLDTLFLLFHSLNWWHETYSENIPLPWCDCMSVHYAAPQHTLHLEVLLLLVLLHSYLKAMHTLAYLLSTLLGLQGTFC